MTGPLPVPTNKPAQSAGPVQERNPMAESKQTSPRHGNGHRQPVQERGPMAESKSGITPLAGISVVDFSQNLAGPYATQILADLGADVIKVEPPGGDSARRWGPPFIGGQSPLFQVANRNKRSVVLDLKREEDRRRARALTGKADVVVQALRQGAPERLGIGYEQVREDNLGVVYVSVTAYGTEGPLKDDPGYDPLMQARSGLMDVTGHPDGGPARVGTSVVDFGTGLWTAVAVLAALMERSSSGKGCHITSSLFDTSLAWMSYHLTSLLSLGSVPTRMGTSIGMIAPYQDFPCVDGTVLIAAGNDVTFARLCVALGLDLAANPEFASNASRVARREQLARLIADRTRSRSAASLLELLQKHQVPSAPVHSVTEAASDPQTAASGMLRRGGHPEIKDYVDIPLPIRWDGKRAPFRRFPPATGEHQAEVFPEDDTEDV